MAITFSLFQQLFADVKGFESAQFDGKTTVIPYRFQHFEGKNVPCIFVFLHGNSASGTDNEKQLEKDTLLNAVSYIEKVTVKAIADRANINRNPRGNAEESFRPHPPKKQKPS